MDADTKTKKITIGKDSALRAAVMRLHKGKTGVGAFTKVFEHDDRHGGYDTNLSCLRVLSKVLYEELNEGFNFPAPYDSVDLHDFKEACDALKNISEDQEITIEGLQKIHGTPSILGKIRSSSHDFLLSARQGLISLKRDIAIQERAEKNLAFQKGREETPQMTELRSYLNIFLEMETKYDSLCRGIDTLMPDVEAVSRAAKYLAAAKYVGMPRAIRTEANDNVITTSM